MKMHLPLTTMPKTRLQMAAEYNMEIKAFRRRLKQEGVVLARGQIIPSDQTRIYIALGPPTYVMNDQGKLTLFDPK